MNSPPTTNLDLLKKLDPKVKLLVHLVGPPGVGKSSWFNINHHPRTKTIELHKGIQVCQKKFVHINQDKLGNLATIVPEILRDQPEQIVICESSKVYFDWIRSRIDNHIPLSAKMIVPIRYGYSWNTLKKRAKNNLDRLKLINLWQEVEDLVQTDILVEKTWDFDLFLEQNQQVRHIILSRNKGNKIEHLTKIKGIENEDQSNSNSSS